MLISSCGLIWLFLVSSARSSYAEAESPARDEEQCECYSVREGGREGSIVEY
jgi:hypothetical protein